MNGPSKSAAWPAPSSSRRLGSAGGRAHGVGRRRAHRVTGSTLTCAASDSPWSCRAGEAECASPDRHRRKTLRCSQRAVPSAFRLLKGIARQGTHRKSGILCSARLPRLRRSNGLHTKINPRHDGRRLGQRASMWKSFRVPLHRFHLALMSTCPQLINAK